MLMNKIRRAFAALAFTFSVLAALFPLAANANTANEPIRIEVVIVSDGVTTHHELQTSRNVESGTELSVRTNWEKPAPSGTSFALRASAKRTSKWDDRATVTYEGEARESKPGDTQLRNLSRKGEETMQRGETRSIDLLNTKVTLRRIR